MIILLLFKCNKHALQLKDRQTKTLFTLSTFHIEDLIIWALLIQALTLNATSNQILIRPKNPKKLEGTTLNY